MSESVTRSQDAVSLDSSPTMAMTTLYSAAVGPIGNDYYLPLFSKFEAAGRATLSWNWAACLYTVNWMIFRRLWGAALVAAGAMLGTALVLVALGLLVFEWPRELLYQLLLADLGLGMLASGLWSNALFYNHCRQAMMTAVADNKTLVQACAQLSKQSSTRQRFIRLLLVNALLLSLAAAATAYLMLWGNGNPATDANATALAPALSASAAEPAASAASETTSAPLAAASAASAGAGTAATPASEPASALASTPVPTPASAPAATPAAVAASLPVSAPAAAPLAALAASPAAAPAAAASKAPAAISSAAPSPALTASQTAPQPAKAAVSHAKVAAPPASHVASQAPSAAHTKASAAAKAHAATAAHAASKPGAKPAAKATAKPATTAKAAKATASKASQPAKTAAPPTKGLYINAGLFANPDNAHNALAKLQAAGMPATAQEIETSQGPRTRIRVGPIPTAIQAQASIEQIKALNLDAALVKP